MKEEIEKTVKSGKKILRKNPKARFFVASKTGSNARGIGADRSVILGTVNGISWFQWYKCWGSNNEARAREIVNKIYSPQT